MMFRPVDASCFGLVPSKYTLVPTRNQIRTYEWWRPPFSAGRLLMRPYDGAVEHDVLIVSIFD